MKYKLYEERFNLINKIENINLKKSLIFYLQTSAYTYLGPYTNFVQNLPDNLNELCTLQRLQVITAQEVFNNENIRKEKDNVNGDMTKIPIDRFNNEEDIFQTAINLWAELLRRNENYSINRKAEDKLQIVCRGNSLMLASALKAKGIPCRLRVGFAKYHNNEIFDDQWNVEYYDLSDNRWKMIDVFSLGSESQIKGKELDVPKNFFLTSADAWKQIRSGEKLNIFDTSGYKGIKAAWLQLMNDFSCLMNNEHSFLFEPEYMYELKNNRYEIRDFTDDELNELDELANLMLNNDENFYKLYQIYKKQNKYRKLLGISTWN